ncbi:MAG: cytochrome bd ubiquinol oxidase subunit [Chloroflexota bacterium]|jgi:cytochrome bd-type quinol oxidase subunit 2|nr:cytochrome bd ubiquinol oxidase subunit [Chloroflexota bacterium]
MVTLARARAFSGTTDEQTSLVLLTVVFGVAVGNIVRGVPLDSSGYYEGLFAWILNPYALLIGALSLCSSPCTGRTGLP